MPFNRRSKQQIYEDVRSDIVGELPPATPWLRRNLLGLLAKAVAGVAHGLYGALDQLSRNLLPTTRVESILTIWCLIFGVSRLQATKSNGSITITGNDGAVVPAGTVYQVGDVQYSVDADITVDGVSGTGDVTALVAGAAGNVDAGAVVTLVAPVAGVDPSATVAAGGLAGGAYLESLDAWRTRLLQRIQEPPQGGAVSDYYRWVREAHPAVSDIWVKPHVAGIGTITIRFMTYDATADGIPDPQVVQAVFDYVDGVRPVKAKELFVIAPQAAATDYEIAINPNTAAVRAAVTQQLEDLHRREAAPGVFPTLSHINEAISLAAGEEDHQLLSPVAAPTLTANEIPVLGNITWSDLRTGQRRTATSSLRWLRPARRCRAMPIPVG